MKKTLLSVLASFLVIGSAFAVPSVDERKALCDKHPDKYVWVEKTQACVPVNPCESANSDIRAAYCAESVPVLPSDISKRNTIMDEYVHRVMGTVPSEIKEVSDKVVGIKTDDGRYIAFMYGSLSDQSSCLLNLMYAVSVYGHLAIDLHQMDGTETNHFLLGYGDYGDISEEEMKNIADFASRLQDDIITYSGFGEDGALKGAVFTCSSGF